MLELGRLAPELAPRFVPTLGRRLDPIADLRSLFTLVRLARAYRPDIVHTHLAKAGFIGRIAGRLAGAPVIVHTYHGTVLRGYFGRLASAAFLGIERFLGLLTTRVVAITRSQAEDVVALGIVPADRVVEIPLGFDLEPFLAAPARLDARRRLGLAADAPVVAIVARLVPIKDLDTFLSAVALLRAELPGVEALVVGDGTERARLESLARSVAPSPEVRFLGVRADVASIYAAADVVALTSLNEGSPVSLIEAMACGRAVVATRVGGVADVVEDGVTGLLVPARDARGLSRALAQLLRSPAEAARMGAAGRDSVRTRFAAARLVADVERLYDHLLAVGGRP